ncbi:hypothetical protein RI367_008099 [Sorochytrium milnesiophthora]
MTVIKAPSTVIQATHCLFDMDGLLLNTEDIYTEASSTILQRFNKTYDWALKAQLMGLREDEAARLFVSETGVPMTPEEYLAERNALHQALFPSCTPLPGIVELVTLLHTRRMPIAVATSSHRAPFLLKSQNNAHLFDLFDGNITTGDDAHIKRGKPAPDLFLASQEQLQTRLRQQRPQAAELRAENAVVFEDAPSGVLAGLNAGMNVVWVRDRRFSVSSQHLDLQSRCFAVLESMEEFDPRWIGVAPIL